MDKTQAVYEFGPFRLDVAERLLLREGKPVFLTPKVFDLLTLLVENHGHLMEKEALIKALWPESFVEEANLNVNISALRRALGESPSESHFIETVPRRGYRFIAPVVDIYAEAPAAVLAAPQPVPVNSVVAPVVAPQPKVRRWVLWSMVAFVLIAAASVVGWRFTHPRTKNTSAGSIHTIAVLPFRPLTNDAADAALEMGMADALITRLSNSKRIIVRPTSSVMRYAGATTNAITAGQELEVDAVLEGRVQRADNRIRVTVQLLRVSDQTPLWAEKFDDYFTNIFAVQDSISEKMADALAMHLSRDDKQLMIKRPTEDTEAYQLYMQGRYHYFKYEFDKALTFFESAVEKDPDYALAQAGLALDYVALSATGSDPQGFRDKAIATANKAVSLDPELDETHNALGWVKYLGQWDWDGAAQEFQRALQLNPNNAQAHINYASILSVRGHHDEALQEGEAALRLDPMSGDVYFNHILHLYFARRYDQALAVLKKGMEVDPQHPRWNSLLMRLYLIQSRYNDVIAEAEKSNAADEKRRSVYLAFAYYRLGRQKEGDAIIAEYRKRGSRPGANGVNALVAVGRNDKQAALDWLIKAFAARETLLTHIKVEPLFDSLRSEPRFQDLQRRMKLE